MAPKRLLEDPPSVASDSEETEETEFENDVAEDDQEDNGSDGPEDDEDGDDDRLSKKPDTVSALSKPTQRQRTQSGSGDESGSDSDTESDKTEASPSASAFTVKPVVAKPTDMKSSSVKRNLNLAAAPAPAPTVASGSKRTSQGDIEGKDSKKSRVSNGNDDDAKKGHFQRIWTVDDEVAILKGMIEFQSKRGVDPTTDMGIFYKFIKNNLHADMSEKQLMDKIRRLKKKYQNNAKKGENGEDHLLSKPHELKCYEFSKKIWGAATSNGVDENAKKKKKPTQSRVKNSSALASPNANLPVKKDEEANDEANDELEKPSSNSSLLDDLLGSGKLFSQPEAAASVMKEALPLIGSAEAKELEKKWKNLQEEELELYLKRIELVHESAKLLLEAKKSSRI